jgi:formate dehydrogenase subunit gamma
MSRYIQRYSERERFVHWTVAICFVLAALSGLAFFHPSLYWLSDLFGGGTWDRILHPFIGVLMALVFCYTMVNFWRANRLDDSDKKWLDQWRDVVNNREDKLPPVGRFNAGQKLVFWITGACVITLFVTGLIFWRPYFADFYPIGLVRLATLLHSLAAFVLIVTIIVHIYSAIWVKGSFRAMLRGDVSEAWAKKHHPAWDRQTTR